jgi:hypothetical protein
VRECDVAPALLRIVYLSQATGDLSPEALAAIEASSRRRNAKVGITGLLIADESFFYGILEGPPRALLAQMEVIAQDNRHRALRVLREHPVEARRFLNWRLFRLPEVARHRRDNGATLDFILEIARNVR